MANIVDPNLILMQSSLYKQDIWLKSGPQQKINLSYTLVSNWEMADKKPYDSVNDIIN